MTQEELDLKKFELDQKVRLEELEIKKKELDLKIAEQNKQTFFTPLLLAIAGGLITLIIGLLQKHGENKAAAALEDKRFQSSLLLKATEAKDYDDFSDLLQVFRENGLLSLDSVKINNFRRKKFIAAQLNDSTRAQPAKEDTVTSHGKNSYWTIVTGGNANLQGAKSVQDKSSSGGFANVTVWFRNNSYRTCIGAYSSYDSAVNDLFDVKEKINSSSYIVRMDKWCPDSKYDTAHGVYLCK